MPSQLHIAIKAVELYAATHPRPAHVTQRQAALSPASVLSDVLGAVQPAPTFAEEK